MLINIIKNKRRRFNDREEDRERELEREQRERDEESHKLRNATTLYVGNLYVDRNLRHDSRLTRARSFYTTEEQIHELFAKYVASI